MQSTNAPKLHLKDTFGTSVGLQPIWNLVFLQCRVLEGLMVVLRGGGGVSYERGTPVELVLGGKDLPRGDSACPCSRVTVCNRCGHVYDVFSFRN